MTTAQTTTGTLHYHRTAEPLRPATAAEHITSLVRAGRDLDGVGVITVDGRACFVPEPAPAWATGVRWSDGWTECLAVVTNPANARDYHDALEGRVEGEWVGDADLTGGDDCGCDLHTDAQAADGE